MAGQAAPGKLSARAVRRGGLPAVSESAASAPLWGKRSVLHSSKAAQEINRQVPRGGWVRTLRSALGMSERSFAKRLGVHHGALQKLERNEQRGSVSLETLRRAAEALDADLVYAIVPRKSLRAVIGARARRRARAHEAHRSLYGPGGSVVVIKTARASGR